MIKFFSSLCVEVVNVNACFLKIGSAKSAKSRSKSGCAGGRSSVKKLFLMLLFTGRSESSRAISYRRIEERHIEVMKGFSSRTFRFALTRDTTSGKFPSRYRRNILPAFLLACVLGGFELAMYPVNNSASEGDVCSLESSFSSFSISVNSSVLLKISARRFKVEKEYSVEKSSVIDCKTLKTSEWSTGVSECVSSLSKEKSFVNFGR